MHSPSHMPVLASMASRVRKDKTGHTECITQGTAHIWEGKAQCVISEICTPLAQGHHGHSQHLLECARILLPLPWGAARKETDVKMCLLLGTGLFLSCLFLLCVPWNKGVTSQTFPEGCREDLQIQDYIEHATDSHGKQKRWSQTTLIWLTLWNSKKKRGKCQKV